MTLWDQRKTDIFGISGCKKTYDTVWREGLWMKMRVYGFRIWKKKRLGIEVEGIWCGRLLYADDIVLSARDLVELQVMLAVVGKYAMKWRFRFNTKKSKTMMVGGIGSRGE